MSKPIKKEILDYADTEEECREKIEPYWAQGEKNVTFATVAHMIDPPKTVHKFVIIRISKL